MGKNNKEKNKQKQEDKKKAPISVDVGGQEPVIVTDDMEVTMTFSEDKFYDDHTKPMFEAGKKYPLKGKEWIARWLRRGGKIVGPGSELNPASPEDTQDEKPEDIEDVNEEKGKYIDPEDDSTEDELD